MLIQLTYGLKYVNKSSVMSTLCMPRQFLLVSIVFKVSHYFLYITSLFVFNCYHQLLPIFDNSDSEEEEVLSGEDWVATKIILREKKLIFRQFRYLFIFFKIDI